MAVQKTTFLLLLAALCAGSLAKNVPDVETNSVSGRSSGSSTGSKTMPTTRDEWLALIEAEMHRYEKEQGPDSLKGINVKAASQRILKFLVDHNSVIRNSFKNDPKNKNPEPVKVWGEGQESKFPPVFEFVLQRIQAYFSVYKYEDLSRPVRTSTTDSSTSTAGVNNSVDEPKNGSSSSSATTADGILNHIEKELDDYLDGQTATPKNTSQSKLPLLIKSAYNKFQSWFGQVKSSRAPVDAEKEDVEGSGELTTDDPSQEDTEEDSKKPDPTDKIKIPDIIKGAYETIDSIMSIFDGDDSSDDEGDEKDEETTEENTTEDGAEVKVAPGGESEEDDSEKDSLSGGLLDFLTLAYTLYESS